VEECQVELYVVGRDDRAADEGEDLVDALLERARPRDLFRWDLVHGEGLGGERARGTDEGLEGLGDFAAGPVAGHPDLDDLMPLFRVDAGGLGVEHRELDPVDRGVERVPLRGRMPGGSSRPPLGGCHAYSVAAGGRGTKGK